MRLAAAVFATSLLICSAIPCLGAQQAPVIPSASAQIAAAVTPLPEELKADASVLGYVTAGTLVSLRTGKPEIRAFRIGADDFVSEVPVGVERRGLARLLAEAPRRGD